MVEKLTVNWGRRLSVAIVGMAMLAATASSCTSGKKSAQPRSTPTQQSLLRFFGPHLEMRKGGNFGLDRIELQRASGEPFGTYLRVHYPQNSGSNRSAREDGTNAGGAQVYLRMPAETDHQFLRYRIRLPSDFNFVKGGKLPGLYGGTMTSGGKIPDGTDGFSTRYMWRTGGAAEVYAYLPTSKEHGTSLGRGSWSWPTGQWTCVEQEVHLNTPGRSNGLVRVWLNGRQVLLDNHLTYRSTSRLRIEGVFFSTFFGGGDASWATPREQYADFADFQLGAARIGC